MLIFKILKIVFIAGIIFYLLPIFFVITGVIIAAIIEYFPLIFTISLIGGIIYLMKLSEIFAAIVGSIIGILIVGGMIIQFIESPTGIKLLTGLRKIGRRLFRLISSPWK